MIKNNVMLVLLVGALGFAAGCDFSLCNKKCSTNAEAAERSECSSCTDCASCDSHASDSSAKTTEASAADAVSDSEVAAAVEAAE
ncbi:MAG: hypothetical protein WCG20_04205 [bacterium]